MRIINIAIYVVFGIIVAVPQLLICVFILSHYSKSKWFCRKLGWHKDVINTGFDGCSLHGKCNRCGEELLQDSNGDWF